LKNWRGLLGVSKVFQSSLLDEGCILSIL